MLRGAATLLLFSAAAIALAGCGGSKASAVASLGTTSSTHAAASATTIAGRTSGSGPAASRAQLQADLLRFAACMRSHGVPSFPDPIAPGGARAGGVSSFLGNGPNPNSSPRYRGASAACRKCAVAEPVTPAGAALVLAEQLRYASCMRAHGEPEYPDPSASGGFTIPKSIDENSMAFLASASRCRSLLPGATGPPGVGAG